MQFPVNYFACNVIVDNVINEKHVSKIHHIKDCLESGKFFTGRL